MLSDAIRTTSDPNRVPSEDSGQDAAAPAWLRRSAVAGAVGVGAVGCVVLVGWILDIEPLKRLRPGLVAMNPATAVCFVLAGLALWLQRSTSSSRLSLVFARAAATVVVALGAVRMGAYILGLEAGVDRLLIGSRHIDSTGLPNRMAPNTALCLVLCGGALLLLGASGRRLARVREALAVTAGLASLLAAFGYLYQVDTLYRLSVFMPMALHTSLAFITLSLAVLMSRPTGGLAEVAISKRAGGVMARRLLPGITGAILAVSWLRLAGQQAGLFETEFGVALMASSMTALCVGFILWCAALLNRADGQRELAQRELERNNDELEERVQERTADLLRSNQELEQFAYVASHDLQEPLRMVGSYLQLLERRYKGRMDPEADEFIGFAVDGASRMKQLINDLLQFSRIGRRGGTLVATDLAEVVRLAMVDLGAPVAESGAEIIVGDLPTAQADPTQMRQLFQNLIGNALKFRGEQRPRIVVGAERRGGWWTVRVTDNGIGIDPRYAGRVFEVFQRLHSREEYPGTGIGLAICKKIVDRHGGEIHVQPADGGGSTFSFTLPAQETKYGRPNRAA